MWRMRDFQNCRSVGGGQVTDSLSLLVPVRNAQATLEGSIVRILEVLPELTTQFEVVIVDAGSKDATPEVAEELTHKYPQLRVARQIATMGQTGPLETALASAASDYVFVHNSICAEDLENIRWMWHNRRRIRPRFDGAHFPGLPLVFESGNSILAMADSPSGDQV
jgi:glycosyltransferase involved in cell wall biosynthesis